ncbi:MAG: FlgD immunoglobulin-like domain containing protein, partial [Fibrobacterota bacterium]
VSFHGGESECSSGKAESARDYLITEYNWDFIDGGVSVIHEEEVRPKGIFRGVFFGINPVSVQDETVDIFVVTGDPAQVSITIYDMVGNVIDRQDAVAQTREAGRFSWDLRNQQGMRVCAGSYAVIATVEYHSGSVQRYRAVLGVQE